MRQLSACCLISAVLASLLTAWMIDAPPQPTAAAQNPNGPKFPGPAANVPPRNALPKQEELLPDEEVGIALYENTNRSVVHITSKGTRADNFFFLEIEEGTGSGSVLDRSGHVLTNYHVIEGAQEVNVGLFDGSSWPAKLVGADPISDIAVLKIDAPKDALFPLTLGDSGRLKVGMRVFAIGNPFGLERTMATGIISSLNRSLQIRGNRSVRNIIQIDASVNPGNSGGPLLDSRGRLIGITTAIASKTGQSAGVGFAIPANLVLRVVPELIRFGRVIRPDTGIVKVYQTEQGLLIASLTPDGPAERAGLHGPKVTRQRRGPFVIQRVDRLAADRIVGVDGKKVETADDLADYVDSKKPGDQVVLEVIREGRRVEVPIELGGGEPVHERPNGI